MLYRFIFLFCLLSVFTLNAAEPLCQNRHCLAVIDAGSTGSRLHVYAYDLDKTNTPIAINELWSKKIKPGLATLEPKKPIVDAYLTSLFSEIPVENLEIYFYATAGMRLLAQPRQQQFYALLQQWFEEHPQWRLRCAKTLTGGEEGLLGWLAVNYQLGRLDSAENKKAIAVMDMGGASVQIAFPVQSTAGIDSKDIHEVKLYGQSLVLFVHSFLGLGQTEVSHQFLDTMTCFADDYELPAGIAAMGDAYSCANEISALMNSVHHVNRIVQPIRQANPVVSWYVLGGIIELAKSKPFSFTAQQFTNQNLLNQADTQICHQRWTDLNSRYPADDYLYGYCLFSAYYYALMVNGYGLQPQETIHYLSPSQNNDWTLAVVLKQPG